MKIIWIFIIILAPVLSVQVMAAKRAKITPEQIEVSVPKYVPQLEVKTLNNNAPESTSVPVPVPKYPEPQNIQIDAAKDYYKKAYGYNTKTTCTGKMCIPAGSMVGCTYSYNNGGTPGSKVQICNIQTIKNADGTETNVSKQNFMMVTGIVNDKNEFTPKLPENEVLFVKRSFGKWKQKKFEQNDSTEGKVLCPEGTDCKNLGKAETLATEVLEATSALETQDPDENLESKDKPLPKYVSLTCNASQSAETCQVCNCFHESRGEPLPGKIAVIRTVLARLNNKLFPGSSSVCRVVFARAQFSWTGDKHKNDISTYHPGEIKAFQDCKEAAAVAAKKGSGTPYFYNPRKASPRWARSMKICATIGNHRFVAPEKDGCPANLKEKI